MWDLINTYIKAFWSKILKNLVFSISKTDFITYNTSLYNISYIKTSIFFFFNTSFKHSFFIIFYSSSLSHPVSLFLNPSPPPANPPSKKHTHTQQTHQAKKTHTVNPHPNPPLPIKPPSKVHTHTTKIHSNNNKPTTVTLHYRSIAQPTTATLQPRFNPQHQTHHGKPPQKQAHHTDLLHHDPPRPRPTMTQTHNPPSSCRHQ